MEDTMRPQVCLCLSGKTIQEDLDLVEKYRNYVDIAELRVDQLSDDEKLHIRKFPEMAGIPCILTIRRTVDGGAYYEGEATRTILFAKALAYADQDTRKNFAYIDLETDYLVPSLQEAALAFGTRIIRSYHNMTDMETNLYEKMQKMRLTGHEIPKIACMPHSLLQNQFRWK
jgi:3-dehydroquinate dehydratase/shikimate dehydrogenase